MIRLLNFCCFAVTGLACLALYHVSEQTRIARVQLHTVQQQIGDQREAMKVLEADWERVSDPSRIQQLASAKLGVGDAPTATLASLEMLPRRSEAATKDIQQASVEQPARPADPRLHYASLHAGE
jgi:cell division protein FtsL